VDQVFGQHPGTALSRAAGTLVFAVGACGRCSWVAPHAVTSGREFELASTNRAALIKMIPILGDER